MLRTLLLLLTAALVVSSVSAVDAGMMVHRVKMVPTPLAANAGLGAATGFADVDDEKGTVKITVTLGAGSTLPMGSVLEG